MTRGVGRPRTRGFGPELTDTLERGDILMESYTGRVLVMQHKEYLPDMSIVYHFDAMFGKTKTAKISERSVQGQSGRSYTRIYKTRRRLMELSVKEA